MHTIFAATAKRSGPSITVAGKDVQGRDIKLMNVSKVTITPQGGIATTKDGAQYALRPDGASAPADPMAPRDR